MRRVAHSRCIPTASGCVQLIRANTQIQSTRMRIRGYNLIVYNYISREAQPRRNVYWPRPSVCLTVCLSLDAFPHYCTVAQTRM